MKTTDITPPIDLGHGVVITDWIVDEHGNTIGLVERHPADPSLPTSTSDGRCAGSIRFDTPEAHAVYKTPGAFWQVVSWEPLTVAPSLLCHACGNHGFIENGRWRPV